MSKKKKLSEAIRSALLRDLESYNIPAQKSESKEAQHLPKPSRQNSQAQ